MTTEQRNAENEVQTIPIRYPKRRIRFGLIITIVGLLIFLVGARPDVFGLDRSPVMGFIQIAVFTIGLAVICVGGYITMLALWKDQHISIAADIGQRLVATGYVVAVFAGMSDIFGLGSHVDPILPYFGIWQARGVNFGQILIALGFLLMIPFRTARQRESLDQGSGSNPIADSIS